MKNKNNELINEAITAAEVRLVGVDSEALGVVSTKNALEKAQDLNVDLVLISPNAKPPVARLIDYGKFCYDRQRKEKEMRKKQKNFELKELRVTPLIATNDLATKLKHAKEFLEKGHKVQFTVFFKGRQLANKEIGYELLERVITDLQDVAEVDGITKAQGRKIFVILKHKK